MGARFEAGSSAKLTAYWFHSVTVSVNCGAVSRAIFCATFPDDAAGDILPLASPIDELPAHPSSNAPRLTVITITLLSILNSMSSLLSPRRRKIAFLHYSRLYSVRREPGPSAVTELGKFLGWAGWVRDSRTVVVIFLGSPHQRRTYAITLSARDHTPPRRLGQWRSVGARTAGSARPRRVAPA